MQSSGCPPVLCSAVPRCVEKLAALAPGQLKVRLRKQRCDSASSKNVCRQCYRAVVVLLCCAVLVSWLLRG
jgi:hypothetical protein